MLPSASNAPTNRSARPRAYRHPVRGFSLLEVLIAIVVLSFGVLGVVGLQATALQANKEARYQSAAVRLARELADLIRGNNQVAALTTQSANPYLIGTIGPGGTTGYAPPNCYAATCTNTLQMAQFQMNEWVKRVQTELPGAQVAVCFDQSPYASGKPQWTCAAGTGGVLSIKIGWSRGSTDRGAAAASAVVAASTSPLVVVPVVPG